MIKIRVRGWHVKLQRMFSPEEMAADQMTLLPTGQFINVASRLEQSVIYPVDKFIPLLSTGLYDKNGVEIFKGDVVKACIKIGPQTFRDYNPDGPDKIWTDEYHKFYPYAEIGSSHVVRYDNQYAGFQPFCDYDSDCGEGNPPDYFEIIGNIYENQELRHD